MRTLFVRSFQSVIAFAAVALLTGANDAGCGLGTVINGGTGGGQTTTGSGTTPVEPTSPIVCPDGLVAQLVCDPAPPTGGGVIAVDVCNGPDCPPPPPPCDPDDANCVPPTPGNPGTPQCAPDDPNCPPSFPPPGCSFQCVPPGPVCPPGTDEVTVCVDNGGGGGDGEPGTGGSFGGEIPPDDANTPVSNVTCWTECAPHGCGGGEETPSSPPIPD
jgi:hypothetical protein